MAGGDIVVTVIFYGDQQCTLMHILPLASLLHNTQLILHKVVILLIASIRFFPIPLPDQQAVNRNLVCWPGPSEDPAIVNSCGKESAKNQLDSHFSTFPRQ